MKAIGALDPISSRYAQEVHAVALASVGEDIVGFYIFGSAATGPFLPGQSDLDVLVVVRDWLGEERVGPLLGSIRGLSRPGSVRGLDLWVLPLESTQTPCADPLFEAWLLTSIDSQLTGGPSAPGDARLVLLYAMCRDHGLAVTGPPPWAVFAPVERSWLIDAMRVDLALTGTAGWYRVLNACRTLYFLEEGAMCGKLTGAAWARERLRDPSLIDDAVAWRRRGSGPPLLPDRVQSFVAEVASRLEAASPTAVPAGVPAVESQPRVTVVDTNPLVSCVLLAPHDSELLALAARRFSEQDWDRRELLVLGTPDGVLDSAVPPDHRLRAVAVGEGERENGWRELALREARGTLIASWDPSTWYAPDRLSQQVRELLSTTEQRLVTPSLLAYDPRTKAARRVRALDQLERATLCAHRDAWGAVGAPVRLGERSDIAVLVDPVVSQNGGEPAPPGEAQALLGADLDVYAVVVATASSTGSWMPAASCLMPTYNRPRFALQAIRYFLQQDYPNRELVIVDDSGDSIADLIPADTPIRYHRLDKRETIGRKRELACELADGELLVQWDDDDWYGASRLRRQIVPLAAGSADIAGILRGYLLDLTTLRFWKGGPPLHEGHLHSFIVSGTLAFTRPAWRSTGGYPSKSLGEEVYLLQSVIERGGRVAPIVNDGIYVCVRHASNSWRLPFDPNQGPPGWAEVPPPDFVSATDLDFYREHRQVARA